MPKLAVPLIMVAATVFALPERAHAGFLYVLNERNGAPNQIYGFNVNESNGALTPLAGFPISSGGNGLNTRFSELLTIDRANFRLYVLNAGSDTISAFSINLASGALTHLPFSPFSFPAESTRTLKVHSSGSPLLAADSFLSSVFSFNIAATTATPAAGSPFSTGTATAYSSVLSRDGNFYYAGGNSGNPFAGFGVNPKTGVLMSLPGSPFNSGNANPAAYASDSLGRFFTANFSANQLRAFTTSAGVPTAVTANPFAAGLTAMKNGALHPNEKFFYVNDDAGDRVGAYAIAGSGAATTLTPIAGSPVNSGGMETGMIVLNNAGTYLFAANSDTRNITTYSVSLSTGALTFNNVQPANSLGAVGALVGMDYLPSVFSVLNTNDSGAGSLRSAVTTMNSAGGGIISFHPTFFNVPRTISLTSGHLNIESNISIVGTGANMLTVRNSATRSTTSRIILITSGTVDISGITITGGDLIGLGGGIRNHGLLTIRNSVVSDNFANGVGGGISSASILTIINSTVSDNTSASINGGGGIENSGTLFVTNSTISGNTKSVVGVNNGGGIQTSDSTTIINSTITNNSTQGSAGGVSVAPGTPITVRNSIIAGNRNNGAVSDVAGTFISAGFNLIGNRGTAIGFNQPGDQSGTGASPLDPKLVKVLAYKGGRTPVHVPLPNSPAVDKGNNANLVTDQRGFNRPFDDPAVPNTSDGADIGAFERRASESIFTAPFDFDGDGKTDIGIFRPSVAEWWINQSSTGVTTAAQFGARDDVIVPGDFTGDGKADIAFWRPLTGFWFVMRSEDFSFFAFPFGTRGDIPTVGDFDGDALADATVYRPSSGTWFIQRSSDGGATIQQFGAPGDVPVPADYDGDGRVDIAIWRLSVGQWWLLRSTAGVFATTFGNPSDWPVQGDYTGDGKSDVAFWRPSTGEWFILRSEDLSFFSFPFGLSSDIPAPGDYDGDGRHDATVFRPSQATWFSQRSTAGTLIQQFGAANDRPIPNAFVPIPN